MRATATSARKCFHKPHGLPWAKSISSSICLPFNGQIWVLFGKQEPRPWNSLIISIVEPDRYALIHSIHESQSKTVDKSTMKPLKTIISTAIVRENILLVWSRHGLSSWMSDEKLTRLVIWERRVWILRDHTWRSCLEKWSIAVWFGRSPSWNTRL